MRLSNLKDARTGISKAVLGRVALTILGTLVLGAAYAPGASAGCADP